MDLLLSFDIKIIKKNEWTTRISSCRWRCRRRRKRAFKRFQSQKAVKQSADVRNFFVIAIRWENRYQWMLEVSNQLSLFARVRSCDSFPWKMRNLNGLNSYEVEMFVHSYSNVDLHHPTSDQRHFEDVYTFLTKIGDKFLWLIAKKMFFKCSVSLACCESRLGKCFFNLTL